MARATPAGLGRLTDGERFQYPPHLQAINGKLLGVAAGRIKRLAVFMPPRHGKSETTSRLFPAWYLSRFARKRIILSSYEAEFASSWGHKAREVVREQSPSVFGVGVSRDDSARNAWSLTNGSRMMTAGVGGAITGKGADILIIDDPVKNAQEAHSKTYRDKAWDWYLSTAHTRLEPDGAEILVMTRWHHDDLAGRIMRESEKRGEEWDVLSFPALAEENDGLGRAVGEPLWPSRFDTTRLEAIRETLAGAGGYWWNALYQQRPSPEEGAIFKRQNFRYFTESGDSYLLNRGDGVEIVPKSACSCFGIVDLAVSEKQTADYFVLGVWAVTPKRDLLLREIVRGHIAGPDQPRIIRDSFARFGLQYVGIESVGYQLSLVQEMRRQGLAVRPMEATGDKVLRSLTVSARYEGGTVFHRQDAPWLQDYEDEVLHFPHGEHDDQVDVASYAGEEVQRGAFFVGAVARPEGW